MRFVDAHIHLSDSEYKGKTSEIVEVTKQAGVVAIVSNSMDYETSKRSFELAEEHAGLVYAALGIHPWNANELSPNEFERTVGFMTIYGRDRKKVVAVGEVGLDPRYAKRKEQKEQQAKVFHGMLLVAETLNLPIIVHSRWSAPKILQILSSYKLNGVLWHWFTSPVEILPKIVERGDYVSEGPQAVLSPKIQEVVKYVPLENLLTETDGPVRYEGLFKDKLTTPAFIPEVVKAISEIKNISVTDAEEQIFRNFHEFFSLNP